MSDRNLTLGELVRAPQLGYRQLERLGLWVRLSIPRTVDVFDGKACDGTRVDYAPFGKLPNLLPDGVFPTHIPWWDLGIDPAVHIPALMPHAWCDEPGFLIVDEAGQEIVPGDNEQPKGRRKMVQHVGE